MSGFDDHDLTHSSVSQLNKWIEAPDSWVAQYLFGHRGSGSAAMYRGICTEDAVAGIIAHGQDIDGAIADAESDFDKKVVFDDDGKAGKERDNIRPMVEGAIGELMQFGKPDFIDGNNQQKVKLTCAGDGWKLDFIGYLDFIYHDLKLVVDLKTTMRMPSTMAPAHQRQRAFYAKATGYDVKFLYVTPKKVALKDDGDVDSLMMEIKYHLIRQERFLSLGDRELLRSIVPVNPGSFYWTGDEKVFEEMYKT